jgi:hypothetical protein
MARFVYTPDQDVKVHEEGAIRLISRAFQSHEAGLPEWLKNSADAYAREDASELKRVIVVIFDQGGKNVPRSISCLDFSGMSSQMIEENFRIWADPEAARRGGKTVTVQGGHGNGGKCYMTQMFEDHAVLNTVKRGKGCRYGVVGGSVRFGYIPDRERGRDFPISDLKPDLDRLLADAGCSIRVLPKEATDALNAAEGFTLIRGVGAKGYEKGIPVSHLIENLEEHPQMIRTLEFCKVYVIANAKLQNDGKPLAPPRIQPMQGAEEPRIIPIPVTLKDPHSDQSVSTTTGGSLPAGTLKLLTSAVSMRYGKKGRHNVVYKGRSGYIGYVPVLSLDVQSPYRDHIYGECFLEALEPFKQNERGPLANSPLVRAVERFISHQVEMYAKEFESRERRRYEQEEKNAISKMNEALDRWKNRFLDDLMRGMWGTGVGPPPPPPPLPTGKPAKLELTLSHSRSGIGVAFRPALKFFDNGGTRIRPVPYRWVSEDTNVAIVDEDLLVVNTFAVGRTILYAQTLDGRVVSNKVTLEVVHIEKIRISPADLEMQTGSRQKLEAICRLAGGEETSSVYLEWVESNSNVARVSAAGLVFGFSPGETEVTAGDDICTAESPCVVKVTPGQGVDRGDRRGRGYPVVLVSGEIDRDPDTKEYIHFSKDDPPVAQRPQDVDRNIWWINSAAPLARLFLDPGKTCGYESREWRMYHLERFIDVIVQIALTHGPTGSESLSPRDWVFQWGFKVAEIQAAAVADLSGFIANGELPKN